MFIYNIKLTHGKLFKTLFTLMIIAGIIICIITVNKILFKSKETINPQNSYEIPTNNYTNILKSVHDDLNTYIGQKITYTGYIYRVYDLKEDEFVLARNMIVSSNFQTVVVGFLCSSENAKNYKDGTWVKITGTITKGYYHGDIPLIEVEKIEETKMPKDELVYPPDNFYIPTSSLLYNKS
ncbi:MAG: hypothetical protein HFJ50_02315 [Clostridia bacterium]|jgi:uncharacterized repeat protein (TIGR03943 family)|nr:hypothetical protein [Clostridia bacterium]